MPSVKIRSSVPPGIIILQDNCTTPHGYSAICSYNCKYLRQINTACTCPGNCVGAATHQHCASGCHTHCSSGSTTHSHLAVTNSAGGGDVYTSGTYYAAAHTHNKASSCTSPTASVGNSSTHQHAANCNAPPFRTYKLMKKSNVVSMRYNKIPLTSTTMWKDTLCLIPPEYGLETAQYNRLIKVTGSPGSTGGCSTHTHASIGAGTHTVCLASHNHSVSGTTSGPSATITSPGCGTPQASGGHTHSTGTVTVGNTTPCTASSNPTHCHGSTSCLPSTRTLAFIKKNSLSLRETPIPSNMIVMWECALSCIPSGFGVSTEFLGKYPFGIPNGCTNPGTNANSCTHSESCAGSHSHSCISVSHTHTASGTTGSVGTSGGGGIGGSNRTYVGSHSHTWNILSACGPTISTTSAGSHTHASVDHKPLSKEIAFIEKV